MAGLSEVQRDLAQASHEEAFGCGIPECAGRGGAAAG